MTQFRGGNGGRCGRRCRGRCWTQRGRRRRRESRRRCGCWRWRESRYWRCRGRRHECCQCGGRCDSCSRSRPISAADSLRSVDFGQCSIDRGLEVGRRIFRFTLAKYAADGNRRQQEGSKNRQRVTHGAPGYSLSSGGGSLKVLPSASALALRSIQSRHCALDSVRPTARPSVLPSAWPN